MIHFDGKTEEQEEVIKLVFDMIEDLRGKYSKEQTGDKRKRISCYPYNRVDDKGDGW